MVEFMKKHLLMLVAILVATAAMIGCGGSNDIITGTQDPRILGDWVASEIIFDGIHANCPDSIVVGDPDNQDTLTCTDRISHFSEDGKLTSGGVSTDYFFGSGILTVYTNPNVTIEVTFEESDTKMRYHFIQNGRDAQVVFIRPAS